MVGTIGDRDIAIRAVAEGEDPDTTTVGDVMSAGIRYCFEDQSLEDAAALMARERNRRLPVLDRNKRLVGSGALADISAGSHASGPASEALAGVSQH